MFHQEKSAMFYNAQTMYSTFGSENQPHEQEVTTSRNSK